MTSSLSAYNHGELVICRAMHLIHKLGPHDADVDQRWAHTSTRSLFYGHYVNENNTLCTHRSFFLDQSLQQLAAADFTQKSHRGLIRCIHMPLASNAQILLSI